MSNQVDWNRLTEIKDPNIPEHLNVWTDGRDTFVENVELNQVYTIPRPDFTYRIKGNYEPKGLHL